MRQGFECNFSKPIFTFPEIHWVVFYWQCDRNGVSGESQIRIGFQRNIRPQLLKSFQTHPNHKVEIKRSQRLKAENQNSDQILAKYSNTYVCLHLWLPRCILHTSKAQLNIPRSKVCSSVNLFYQSNCISFLIFSLFLNKKNAADPKVCTCPYLVYPPSTLARHSKSVHIIW